MTDRTRNNLNPSQLPNAAKYRAVATRPQTWARMVNATNFNAPRGCWEWTSSTNESGYGIFSDYEFGQVFAHRLALHIVGRPVPMDKVVDHLCRNRSCVNPSHLAIVTTSTNILRGEGSGAKNARKTHCIHGHEFTKENTYIGKTQTKIGTPTRTCRECVRIRGVAQPHSHPRPSRTPTQRPPVASQCSAGRTL